MSLDELSINVPGLSIGIPQAFGSEKAWCGKYIIVDILTFKGMGFDVATVITLPVGSSKPIPPIRIRSRDYVYPIIEKIYSNAQQPLVEVCFDRYNRVVDISILEDDVGKRIIDSAEKRGQSVNVMIDYSYGLITYSGSRPIMITRRMDSIAYRKVEECGGQARAVVMYSAMTGRVVGAIVEKCTEVKPVNVSEDIMSIINDAVKDVVGEEPSSATHSESEEQVHREPSGGTSRESTTEEEIPEEELREIEKELEQLS